MISLPTVSLLCSGLKSWLPASFSALKVSCLRLALVISSNLGREFIDWEGLAHDLVLGPGYHADHTYNLLYLERSSCRLLLRDVSHVHTVCVESSLAKRKKTEKQTNSKQLQHQPTQILTIKKKAHTHTQHQKGKQKTANNVLYWLPIIC